MWEYKTVPVRWDKALAGQLDFDVEPPPQDPEQDVVYDWVAEYEGGYKDIGWTAILNEWGSYGWELVNVAPAEYTETVVSAYFAFFKRKLEVEEDNS
jgi:hypothetical protein